jgi:Kef-type K+ transport system membrane component KefB
MSSAEAFLLVLLAVFTLPWALWRLAGGGIRLPLVVVQIVGGILLGPGVLGALAPGAHQDVFRPEVISALNGVAQWAVMLFIFLAGLELDLSESWARRRETLVTAGAALVVPLGLGSVAALVMVRHAGWVGAAGSEWQAVLGIGMACAVTALPILVLFLGQLGLLRQPLGQRVLRYASLDDVAIWSVLALILLDWDRLARQVGFALIFLTAAPLMRRVMPRLAERDRWFVALIWLLAASFAADWAGLHYMVGAFLAGAVLEARWFGIERVDQMRDVILMVLMPVFFLSTGLRTSWEIGGPAVFGAAALLLAASVAGKLAGVHLAGWILGWPRHEATVIGWLLQTKALIMIIFANILLDKEVISPATFTALLLMALGSTVLTMPVVLPRLKRL